MKPNREPINEQVMEALFESTPNGGRKSGQYTDEDLKAARAEGEKDLAFELWAFIQKLEIETDKVQDQILRESRQHLLHELRRIAGGKPDATMASGVRWPRHDTQKLTALRLAALKFWARYDPHNPETAPTNAAVIDWLQSEQDVSKSTADVMATILRADGLKSGPRSKN